MGQLLRQGLRAVAIYFSDVLLWLSVAGIFEVLFFVVAGALCILTAGFVFDSMKKSPIVLVLGSIVALTGTFLVFREVRGMIWPVGPDPAIATPSPDRPPTWPPKTSLPEIMRPTPSPQPGTSPQPGKLRFSLCSGLGREGCKGIYGCEWSWSLNQCVSNRIGSPPGGSTGNLPDTATAPSAPTAPSSPSSLSSQCNVHTKLVCLGESACYWSPLTDRCEKLLFGDRLGLRAPPAAPPAPAKPSCQEISRQSICLTASGCSWTLGRCHDSSLPGGRSLP